MTTPARRASSPKPQLVPPKTAFDYFLSGQHEYKRRRFADAIQDFEMALRKRPDHFWAKCLQAICFIQTGPFRSGQVELERLPPDRARFRLALSASRLCQRPARRQRPEPGQGRVRARVESEETARNPSSRSRGTISTPPSSDSKRTPDNDLSVHPPRQPRPDSIPARHLDQAAADYQEAIRIKKDPNAHADLAHVYQKQGKIDEAIEQFS